MKKISYFLLILFAPGFVWAQQGKVFDNLSLNSEILKAEMKFSIYLPPDYDYSQRSYPVLYLLHGGGGNNTRWVQNGNVLFTADKMINEGIISPLVIVMPNASRGYANNASGTWLYEDFFFNEFITFIEKTYRIRPGKMNRSIAGLSMGGWGTFIYALHYPEMFKAACPLSASPGPLDLDNAKEFLEKRESDLNDSQIKEWYTRNSVLELIKGIPDERKAAVRWYIDCGDDDLHQNVYEGNCLLHITMRKLEIPHEFRIRDGGHTWEYWRSALPEVLKFITFP